jgi:hypothetical protein
VALSDEQNAMLRLLASGEQSYDDIAALMGLSVDEVRAKVVGALAQLEAEGKPAPDVPPPLPGGAKPAAEVTPPEPEPLEQPPAKAEPPAEPVVADSIAPRAPVEPAAADSGAPSAPAPKSTPAERTAASGRNAWLLGGGILAAIVVVVVVILVASGGGGGGSSSTTSTEAATTTAEEGKAEEASTGSKEATQAELTAVDGSEAAGLATFGRVKNKLALQIEATGLEPTTEGTDSYTVWLAQSPQRMLPLASTAVKAKGKGAGEIAAEFEIPVEILGYLANGTFDQLAITRTDDKELEAAIEAATKKKQAPAYTGKAVLRGAIKGPIVGLAKREEEEKKGE